MRGDARVAVRNAGLLILQRGGHVAGALLFAVTVPRLMGPEVFGRYTLLATLAFWFVALGGLGFAEVIARHVPVLILHADPGRVRRLFGHLLTVRLVSATLVAGLYLLLAVAWLSDLDPVVPAIVAGTVLLRAVTNLFFSLFVGLDRAALSGLGELVRRWVLLGLLVTGFHLGGLRGACWGLLATDLVVLALGVTWGRSHASWPTLRLDRDFIAPYLKFGLAFYAERALLITFDGSGEVLVRAASGDYAQVGYFGLAYAVYLTAAAALPQLALAFVPLLTRLRLEGRTDDLRSWVERLGKWLAMGGVAAFLGALFLAGDVVPAVLGVAYRPVAVNLLPMTLMLAVFALGAVASAIAMTYDRPRVVVVAAAIRLVSFWGLGPPLISWGGSLGGCLAALAASVLYTGYFAWGMRDVMRPVLPSWTGVFALAGPFLSLAWLRASLGINLLLCGASLVGYGTLLLWLRVVAPREIVALWRAVDPRTRRQAPAGGR